MTILKILKSPGCGHCAQAERIWEKIRGDYPQVQMETIDIVERPEMALEYGLMATPGIVINGKLETQGGITEKRLRELLGKA